MPGIVNISVIFTGKWRNTVDVAVKTLKQGQMTVEDFLSEAKLMHQLRHHKLVQLMAVCTKSEPIWIITELMVNGALLDFLRKDEGKTLDFKHIADMASQVTLFMQENFHDFCQSLFNPFLYEYSC